MPVYCTLIRLSRTHVQVLSSGVRHAFVDQGSADPSCSLSPLRSTTPMEGPASPLSSDAVQQLPSTETTPSPLLDGLDRDGHDRDAVQQLTSTESTPSQLLDRLDQDAVQQATGAVGGPAQTVDAVDSAAPRSKDAADAAGRGDVQRLQELSDLGVSLSDGDNDGRTPAHHAAFGGHVECLRVLHNEFKVSLSAGDNDGWTPAHAAAQGGHVECLRVLQNELEVNLSAESSAGWTPDHALTEAPWWVRARPGLEDEHYWFRVALHTLRSNPKYAAVANEHLRGVTLLEVGRAELRLRCGSRRTAQGETTDGLAPILFERINDALKQRHKAAASPLVVAPGNNRAIDDTPVASAEPALEQPFPEEYPWAYAERGLDAEQDGFREALSNLTTKNPLDGLQHVEKVVLFEVGRARVHMKCRPHKGRLTKKVKTSALGCQIAAQVRKHVLDTKCPQCTPSSEAPTPRKCQRRADHEGGWDGSVILIEEGGEPPSALLAPEAVAVAATEEETVAAMGVEAAAVEEAEAL